MLWSISLKLQHMEILNEELPAKGFRTGPADWQWSYFHLKCLFSPHSRPKGLHRSYVTVPSGGRTDSKTFGKYETFTHRNMVK